MPCHPLPVSCRLIPPPAAATMGAVSDEAGELEALRQEFPGYRFRRRPLQGIPCYLAEARSPRPQLPALSASPGPGAPPAAPPAVVLTAEVPLVAARSPAVLADMLAVASGRPVRLRSAAVAAAYRDRRLTMQQCAALFGVSRTTIMKFLAAEGVPPRKPGRDLDEPAVAAAYQEGLSLRECAARFGVSERRVAAVLERQGVPRRPVGRPPRSTASGSGNGALPPEPDQAPG
jgi:predicted DNA-binding transcriptional regulator AlpA